MPRRLPPLLLFVLALSLAACFESGPLGVGGDVTPGATNGDDNGDDSPSNGSDEPGGTSDMPGGDDTDDDTGTDTPVVPPCESDTDCVVEDDGDACTGLVRCFDGDCEVDPATIPTCQQPANPCETSECDPETGGCVPGVGCQCEPAAAGLKCGQSVTFSPFDAGLTGELFNYGCGGTISGDGPERTFLFTSPFTETVLISVEGDAAAGVFVLSDGDQGCDPWSCLGSGKGGVAIPAVAGRTYAVIVEMVPGEAAQVEVSVSCGVEAEVDCSDGLDDDGNGLTDCDESVCLGVGDCPAIKETECADGLDEDSDGLTDCDDPSCAYAVGCLQICLAAAPVVYCNYNQGGTTGSGHTHATDYECDQGGTAPAAPGKEIVHAFAVGDPTIVTMSLDPGSGELALYVLIDEGLGCTPKSCLSWGWTSVTFQAWPGNQYFAVIDGQGTEADSYSFEVTCAE